MTIEDEPTTPEPETRRPLGRRERAFSSLRHRGYRSYFWSGMGMSASLGIEQLALAWLTLDLTGSITQLGLAIFVRGVPMAILGLYGGVLADRYNRRDLLMYNQVLTLVNMSFLGVLVVLGAAEMWHVYISSVLLGVTSSLAAPARQALIRSLVPPEDMMNAVALNSMQTNASRIVWPTLAGALIAIVGTGPTFFACAIFSFVGIVFLLPINDARPVAGRQPRRSALNDIMDGVRYTFSTPLLARVMVLLVMVGIGGLAVMQLSPGFAREVMGFNSSETGLFLMASGIGSVIGSGMLLITEVRNRVLLFVLLNVGFGISVVLLAINPSDVAAFPVMAFFGLFMSNNAAVAQTIFQTIVPPHLLGRVMSLMMIAPAISALLTLPLGYLGEELGLRWALGAIGVVMFLVAGGIGAMGMLKMPVVPAKEEVAASLKGEGV